MLWLWILCVLLALTAILCLTRVGICASFSQEKVTVDARIGLFRVRLYPQLKKEKKEQAPDKTAETVQKRKTGTGRSRPKIEKQDIQDAIKTLWPPLKRALERTRRRIRIHPLRLSLILGAADDPASGAELYGYLHAGMWAAMPMLEQLLVIPDPRLHIGLDFDAESTTVEGNVSVSARIGSLAVIGLTFGIPALRWLLRYQKKQKTPSAQAAAAAS